MTKYKRRLKIFIFDLINGIRSEIPFCCVWFFSKRSFKGERCIGRNAYLERHPNDKSGSGYGHSKVNYVRCDKCHNEDKVANVNHDNGTILKWLTRERMLLK